MRCLDKKIFWTGWTLLKTFDMAKDVVRTMTAYLFFGEQLCNLGRLRFPRVSYPNRKPANDPLISREDLQICRSSSIRSKSFCAISVSPNNTCDSYVLTYCAVPSSPRSFTGTELAASSFVLSFPSSRIRSLTAAHSHYVLQTRCEQGLSIH